MTLVDTAGISRQYFVVDQRKLRSKELEIKEAKKLLLKETAASAIVDSNGVQNDSSLLGGESFDLESSVHERLREKQMKTQLKML